MSYTQDERVIAIHTPLGKDVLLLAGFKGTEAISKLFNFQLTLLSEDHNIAFEDIVGQPVTLTMNLADGEIRYLNGIISDFTQGRGGDEDGGSDTLFSFYKATMVPWFWLLTRTTDSRIFQNITAPDIVKQIFTEKGFTDFKMEVHHTYEEREYCVQYQETDFNFVSRLLEDEGIFYFFEHEDGKHTLVMADTPEDHKPCPHQETAIYQTTGGGAMDEDVVTGLEIRQQITPDKYTLNDYHFKTPATSLAVESTSQEALAPTELEIYDYPGCYTKRSVGEQKSNLRMQEHETQIATLKGTSVCRAFFSGSRFEIREHYRDDISDESYVLTAIRHEASEEGSYRGASNRSLDTEFFYANHFECIPFSVPFRPARVTPRPVMKGSQTAIVSGPAGEEIYTDEHGRVKVQFHWDREGKGDENSSCWIRAGQLWAGIGYGAVYIPRIGQEVIVDFLEGDPDQPIIMGCVYHGTNTPPYDLPAEKTKSLIKSLSSLGGGGFNEIRFEDKKGEEQIFVHAEKNQDVRVKNDAFEWIGNDRHLIIKNNQKEHVENNRQELVGADHMEKIGKDRHLKVKGKEAKAVDESHSFTVKGDVIEVFKSNHSEQVTSDYYLKASNIVIEATSNVTVKVGKSYIAIESNGIKIGTTGQIVLDALTTLGIKGTAGVTIESPAQATLKSTLTSVKGDAITTISGGLVKIN